MQQIHSGNAFDDGANNRHWFVGHFDGLPQEILYDDDVELKFSRHVAGERRDSRPAREDGKTVALLISGREVLTFPDQQIELSKLGDYVIWGPGVPHSWEALEDSVMLAVRWPSKPVTIDEGSNI